MTIRSGVRNQLVILQRATVVIDTYGGETPSWTSLSSEWAEVRFGTGQERRSAAQEGNAQSATFAMLRNSVTEDLRVTDRVFYLGDAWDVHGVNPTPDNQGIVVTGVRSG